MIRKNIYAWMDRQIIACDIQEEVVDYSNYFYFNNASATPGRIHIFRIDNLCKEIRKPYRVEPFNDKYDCHYFYYKKHKFYGLVEKEEEGENTDEGK